MALLGTLRRIGRIQFAFKFLFLIIILTILLNLFSLNPFSRMNKKGFVQNRYLAVKLSYDHCHVKSPNLGKSFKLKHFNRFI